MEDSIKMAHKTLLLCSLYALGLSACFSSPQPTQNNPPTSEAPTSPGQTSTPTAQNSAPPASGQEPSVAETPRPGVSTPPGSAPFRLPDNVVAIRFANNDRFLDQQGESTTFAVELVDRNGNVIALDNVPFEWSSSRPTDFSVDAQGKLTALVSSGYSVIEVRVKGTDLEARSVVNVASGGSSGGGGGGGGSSPALPEPTPTPVPNAKPVITQLSANETNVIGAGTLVQITAAATDADDTLSGTNFQWSCTPTCSNGFNTPTGENVYWRTPNTGGAYVLTLTVNDGKDSTTQNITINVTAGQGTLTVNPVPPP